MRPTSTIRTIFGSILVLTCSTADAKSSEQKGKAPLVRPESAPDPDAEGRVRIRHEQEKSRDRFEVKGERLDPGDTYEVYLEDGVGSGIYVSIGTMEDEEDGEFELEFDTDDEVLPLGVVQVSDLIGRRVEVRSGGQVYLRGTVPSFLSGHGGWKKSKSYLVRPLLPPDDDAKGKIELRSRMKDGRHRFKVKAEHLDAQMYHLFVEDAVGSGTFVDAGIMTPEESDEYRFKADTESGAPLPTGAMTADDLSGRLVEVRATGGTVYLSGTVPILGASKNKLKAEADLEGSVGEGEIRIRSKPNKGEEELRIKVKDQQESSTVDLFMENPGSATLELVATLSTDDDGDAGYRVRTKKGQALPFGVQKVSELAGMSVEIRDPNNSQVLLQGTVPSF